jgi:hypothetical protein
MHTVQRGDDSFYSFSAAETYNHTDSEFLKADSSQTRDAGSTASTAIIVGERLIVANVGDSRAVICKGGDGKFVVSNIFHCPPVHLYFNFQQKYSIQYMLYVFSWLRISQWSYG